MAFPILLIPAMVRRALARPAIELAAHGSGYGNAPGRGYGADPSQKALSATLALGITGGVGVLLATALVMPGIEKKVWRELPWKNIPAPTIEQTPVEKQKTPPIITDNRRVDRPDPKVRAPAPDDAGTRPPVDLGDGGGAGTGPAETFEATETELVPDPVFIGAQRDPRFARDFQPPYPTAMQHLEREGRCPVEVVINASGRVSAVSDRGCADSAFFRATQRQALNRWRFRPATRDGVPVESRQMLTVVFTLAE